MRSLSLKPIIRILGVIMSCVGLLMLIPTIYAIFFDMHLVPALSGTALTTVLLGAIIFKIIPGDTPNLNKRQSYLLVLFAWLTTALLGALPYMFADIGFDWSRAFFESMSGLTTTGATVIDDLTQIPNSILLWRSLTQWLGGMGIIVLTIAIFPLLGLGGVNLFSAESPGPTSIKLHPRIKETAKRLWFIYLGLTIVLTFLLFFEGMTFFNAVNHALTTIATGGFSTHNESMGFYDSPLIHYTIILFMFIAGMNYSLIFLSLKGSLKTVTKNAELKSYFRMIIVLAAIIVTVLLISSTFSVELSFRYALFHVASLMTTTGFIMTDYSIWHPFITFLFFCLLFCGASSGSTSGGIKIVRHLVFAKNTLLEYKRMLHPNAILRVRIDKELVKPSVINNVHVFLLTYLLIFFIGTTLMVIILPENSLTLLDAASLVATALGNVGPAIGGEYGPTNTFFEIPTLGKYVLGALMLIGRLEIFTVLIIFSPYFWKEN